MGGRRLVPQEGPSSKTRISFHLAASWFSVVGTPFVDKMTLTRQKPPGDGRRRLDGSSGGGDTSQPCPDVTINGEDAVELAWGHACVPAGATEPVAVADLQCVALDAAAGLFAPHEDLATAFVWDTCVEAWYVRCETDNEDILAAGISLGLSVDALPDPAGGSITETTYPEPGGMCTDAATGEQFCPALNDADVNGDGMTNVNDVVLVVNEIFDF